MKILVAAEVEEISDRALRQGFQLARTVQGELTIMTVVDKEHLRLEAGTALAQAVSSLGLEVSEGMIAVAVGERAAEIVRKAKDGEYDLLIIGLHSSHRFLDRFLGSTSDKILAHSPCPVLIAKGEAGPISRILLCSSGANGHHGPGRSLIQLSSLVAEKRVTVLHVMSQISAMPAAQEGWQLEANASQLMEEDTPEGKLLDDRIRLLEKAGFQAQAKVRHGLVVDEILEEAQSGYYDLVVIGAHGATGWKRYLLDDVAHQIILQTDRSVLVV